MQPDTCEDFRTFRTFRGIIWNPKESEVGTSCMTRQPGTLTTVLPDLAVLQLFSTKNGCF